MSDVCLESTAEEGKHLDQPCLLTSWRVTSSFPSSGASLALNQKEGVRYKPPPRVPASPTLQVPLVLALVILQQQSFTLKIQVLQAWSCHNSPPLFFFM